MAIDITSFSLYKWRYYIGYGLVAIALIGMLSVVAVYSPGALSNKEIASLQATSTIRSTDISTIGVINLPYHILQHFSLSLFGVSQLSIKLPSLLLGIFSAIGVIMLLREWFRRNIAVIASFIAITNGQFLFLAQSGTPDIMYVFWPIWILLLATLIAKNKIHLLTGKIVLFVFVALSLYTPMAAYTLLAMLITVLLHPHFRFVARNLKRSNLLVALLVGLLALSPIIVAAFIKPGVILELTGIPTELPNIFANIATLANLYLGFNSPSLGEIMVPVFGLGAFILILIGFYDLYKNRASAQSYLLNVWVLILIPLMILNPKVTAITLVPAILLIATGINGLISYWYSLFPKNPYARVGGMIPILVMVLLLSASGLERYVYGYHYNPNLRSNFSEDISLLSDKNTQLVVVNDEMKLYGTVSQYNKELDVVTKPTEDKVTYTRAAAYANPPVGYRLVKIISSSSENNSDRFYVYQRITS